LPPARASKVWMRSMSVLIGWGGPRKPSASAYLRP
jgi:hypothetical protein